MPFEVLGKKRESLTYQAEAYKTLVREYLESEGYASRTDSYHEGHLPDIILTHTSEQSAELWVECKATKISPSDKELKKELLHYLMEKDKRMKENVKVMVFATHVAKQKDFQKIFTKKHGPKLIPEWLADAISELKEEEKETITTMDEKKLVDFFLGVDIKIAEPDWLKRVTAEKNRRNRLSTDRYVDDLHARSKRLSEPINESIELITSMLELAHPDVIYRAVTNKLKTKDKIYSYFTASNIETPPFTFFPEKNQISTFCDFDERNSLTKIIKKDSITKLSLSKGEVSPQNIHAILNMHLRRIFWKKGLLRISNKYIYFFPALEKDGKIEDREVEFMPGKKKNVVHVQRMDNGTIHHVFHHAVELVPQRLWDKTFLKIKPTKVFTLDGKTPLEGQKKRLIEEKYRNPMYNRNPAQILEVNFWQSFLSQTNNFEKEKEYWFDEIKFGKLLTTVSPCRPKIQIDTDQTKLGEY